MKITKIGLIISMFLLFSGCSTKLPIGVVNHTKTNQLDMTMLSIAMEKDSSSIYSVSSIFLNKYNKLASNNNLKINTLYMIINILDDTKTIQSLNSDVQIFSKVNPLTNLAIDCLPNTVTDNTQYRAIAQICELNNDAIHLLESGNATVQVTRIPYLIKKYNIEDVEVLKQIKLLSSGIANNPREKF